MRFLQKVKENLTSAGIYALYLGTACILTMLVEWLFNFLLDHLILLSYPVLTVIRIVIYTAGVPLILGFLAYAEGYREVKISVKKTVGCYALALIPHLLLSMLFGFQGFISGGVRFTVGLIFHGWGITMDKLATETPIWMFLLGYLGYAILYGTVMALAKYFGAQSRICDRAELRQHETDEQ